jgi:hypothetical protein
MNTCLCFCSCSCFCAGSGVEVVAGGGAGGGGGTVGCWTGTTCAVLPCKNALPRGSPETVNTAVALQLESKTWVLVVGDGIVIAGGGRFFTGAGAVFTRV